MKGHLNLTGKLAFILVLFGAAQAEAQAAFDLPVPGLPLGR